MNLLNKLLRRGEDEVLPEGMIRDPNTGKLILDPNRANKNIIMGQSDPGLFQSTSRMQASNRIAQEMLKDRMPEGGKARITGLRTHQYHIDPKTGTAYAFADTSGDAGVKFTPLTPPPEIESTGNKTLDAMARNRLNPNQPTTTGLDAPSWVENPPPGHVVGSGASRDLQMSISKAEFRGRQKGGEPAIERYFDHNTGQTYTLHPIAGGEDSDYTLEPQDDGSVKRTNKAFIQKPTEEELIKQELENTRPDTTTTAPPPPPPETLPETSPPIPRPKVPVEEKPVLNDSISTSNNVGLDSNRDESAPPKENPVETDELIKAIREQEGFVSEDPKLGPLDFAPGLQRKIDRVIDPIKSFVSETGSDTSGTNFPAFPLHPKNLEKIKNFEPPTSDSQRRVLAEEAYGGPIDDPPPMDEEAIRARNELIPDSLENLDELTKRLISSESPEFNENEQRLIDSGMDAEAAKYFANRKIPQMSAGADDELLQRIAESEFVGPRKPLAPEYEEQGPPAPLVSEDLPLRTQAFVDPSVSGFGDKTEASPEIDVEQDFRKRADEIIREEFPNRIGITPKQYEARVQQIMKDLRNESYGTGAMLSKPAPTMLQRPGFTSLESSTAETRRNLGLDPSTVKPSPVETVEDEVIPISEGEEAVNQLMLEDRSQIDDLEPISAKAREARIDPVTQMAMPVTEEQDQGSNIFSSLLGQLGQTVKDNPEVAAQLAQLAGNLLSGSAQNRAQRKADAETQRRLGRANMIGAFTGKTPGVQSATADTGGFFSLDTLGKALTGGGKIATGEMQRRVEEAERKRVADLEASREAREEARFDQEGKEFDETLAFQHRKLAQDNILERLGLDLEERNLLQRKEYQNEILRLQKDRLGLDATNMYYEAVARANQANNTKTDEKPLTPSEIAKLSGKISTLDQVSRARENILDAAEDGRLSFLELGPLSLENAPQYIFGSDQAKAKSQIEELVNIVAQTLPGNPSDKENMRVERMLMKMTDRPITIDAIADLFLESHMLFLNNELEGLKKSGYKTGWAYDLLGNYDQRYGEGAEEGQFDAYAQQFIQGEGN